MEIRIVIATPLKFGERDNLVGNDILISCNEETDAIVPRKTLS